MRPAELHSLSAEKGCMTENVSSLRSVKVTTPPCAACASIPCGLVFRKRFWQTVRRQQVAKKYDGANKEDIIGFLADKNVPGDDIVYSDLADEILLHKPEQGYLTISNALQWRLQYARVIALANTVSGVLNYEWQ